MAYKDSPARKEYMAKYNQTYHQRHYYGENAEKIRERVRQRRITHPDKVKSSELKTHYGITLEEYTELLTTQNGVCAICHNPEVGIVNGKPRALAVDHDHDSDKVRGLLCGRCNSALGLLEEDINRLQSMIAYIEKHNA